MELKQKLNESFLKEFKPTNTVVADGRIIEKYQAMLPPQLTDLWKNYGWGKYNDGLIELINPEDYQEVLELWLGKKVPNYVPVAISGFGDLFYYRKLTETDEDVCVLETHFRNIETVIWSLDGFFNSFLLDEDIQDEFLRKELFEKVLNKLGPSPIGQAYNFTPALALGGAEEVKYVEIADAKTHMLLLFDLTA